MKYLFIFIVLLFLHCSIKSPEFTITGQKTALEQQVLGSYQHLTDNTIVTTSARTSTDVASDGTQQEAILQAVKNQKFNKDDIDELKRDKVVGENNRGYLAIRSTPRYEEDERYNRLVDKLMDEENRDRRIIYQRVLAMSEIPEEEKKSNAIFANMQIDQSEPGTLIQLQNGQWTEKTNESK